MEPLAENFRPLESLVLVTEARHTRYELAFSESAREQLRWLPKPIRSRLGRRISQLQDDLAGDVKKLSARENAYRLRVGGYRVLFRLDGNVIGVYAVKDRKNAYE